MSTIQSCPPGDRGSRPGAGGGSGAPGEADHDSPTRGSATGDTALPPGTPQGHPAPGSAAPDPAVPAGGTASPGAHVDVMDQAGRMSRRLSFRGASGIVPLARDFTRQALQAWGWLPAVTADRRAAAEDVLLVVSELVTNACLHAEGPEELWVGSDGKVLRLEVTDRGSGQPAPRTPHRAGRPGGHGIFIVQRLCLDWGVVRRPGVPGKTVWAELAAPV